MKAPKTFLFTKHGMGKLINTFNLLGYTMCRYKCAELVIVIPIQELGRHGKRGGAK